MPPPNHKDLQARRRALNISHDLMAAGIGVTARAILSIEADSSINIRSDIDTP
jgi:hypothetical protein